MTTEFPAHYDLCQNCSVALVRIGAVEPDRLKRGKDEVGVGDDLQGIMRVNCAKTIPVGTVRMWVEIATLTNVATAVVSDGASEDCPAVSIEK